MKASCRPVLVLPLCRFLASHQTRCPGRLPQLLPPTTSLLTGSLVRSYQGPPQNRSPLPFSAEPGNSYSSQLCIEEPISLENLTTRESDALRDGVWSETVPWLRLCLVTAKQSVSWSGEASGAVAEDVTPGEVLKENYTPSPLPTRKCM